MGIDGKEKQEFITNFAIELTNRTLDEREQIAEKYYNIIQRLKKENEELNQYRKSKQASYEAMQVEWNNAVNENRDLIADINEIKENNDWYNKALIELQDNYDSLQYVYQNEHCDNLKYKQALEEIRAYCMTDNIQKYTSDVFYFGKHSKNILKIINEVLK